MREVKSGVCRVCDGINHDLLGQKYRISRNLPSLFLLFLCRLPNYPLETMKTQGVREGSPQVFFIRR